MATNNGIQISTVERILDEVDEWYGNVHKIRRELSRVRRGSENYLDMLPDLSVETGVLKDKAEFAAEILEEYLESSPEPI
jgi:hypothetical protein